jgi:hypothetical protein
VILFHLHYYAQVSCSFRKKKTFTQDFCARRNFILLQQFRNREKETTTRFKIHSSSKRVLFVCNVTEEILTQHQNVSSLLHGTELPLTVSSPGVPTVVKLKKTLLNFASHCTYVRDLSFWRRSCCGFWSSGMLRCVTRFLRNVRQRSIMRHRKLPLRFNWIIPSSGLLRNVI